jgi:succinyl-CoA synthetase beta subunit
MSAQGGVEIEQVAVTDPTAIVKLYVNPIEGLSLETARRAVVDAQISQKAIDGVAAMLIKLYECFTKGDCDLAEINPLILKPNGEVHALDAKVTLDDNAAFRHPEWDEYRATEELDEREKLAREKNLQYIGLDGTVGIIANGAGLAMSTLDVVNQVGGKAANFLDIGGGITRGDEVAKGIVEAMKRVKLRAPIVIRLDGTNAIEGRAIIANAGIDESQLMSRSTMLEAARVAVDLAGKN